MAKLIGYRFTATMLSRGASGKVPSRKLVEAYAQACDADPADAIRLWKAARRSEEELRRREETTTEFQDLATSVRSALTHPELIETFGQLRRAMIQVRAREGQPSLGYLQSEAGRTADGKHFRLPKSSLSAVLRGKRSPPASTSPRSWKPSALPPQSQTVGTSVGPDRANPRPPASGCRRDPRRGRPCHPNPRPTDDRSRERPRLRLPP